MKTVLALALALFVGSANATYCTNGATNYPACNNADRWTGSDKTLHFGVSAILGYSARTFYPNEPWKAVGWAMVPGVIKEATDSHASGKDLAADLAGALVGVYIGGCWVNHKSVVCGLKF